MRKSIKMVLIGLLSMSILTACGGDSKAEVLYKKYQGLIDALENGNDTLAKNEFDKLVSNDVDSETNTGEVVNSEKDTQAISEERSFQKMICGNWMAEVDKEDALDFVLYEDSTCDIAGEKLKWEVTYAKDNYGNVEILRGETPIYKMSIHYRDEGCYRATMETCGNEGTISFPIGVYYYHMNNITPIEITLDNWNNYFEIEETMKIRKNEFDEVSRVDIFQYLVLKEEFGHVVDDLSDIAVEYKVKYINANFMFNVEEKTYSYTLHNELNVKSLINGMGINVINDVRKYGCEIASFWTDEFSKESIVVVDEFQDVVRIQGTIYVIKK